MNEFNIMVSVPGVPGASARALKLAMEHLLQLALRFPPDQRFDWRSASVIDAPDMSR